jgi:hypothetical protein
VYEKIIIKRVRIINFSLQTFFSNFSNMPFANIRISKESRTLHGWYIHPIPYDMTLKDFFEKLVAKE